MRCRLGWITRILTLGTVLALGLNACGSNPNQSQSSGYLTTELASAITASVAENGLVTQGMKAGEPYLDLRATSVLHQAGIPDLPTPNPDGLKNVCRVYGDSVPPQQLAGELSHIFTGDDFKQAIEELDCVSLSAPSRTSQEGDPQHYMVLAATWAGLPGISPKDLSEDHVRTAIQELSPAQGKTPWVHWNCQIISKAIGVQDLCDELHPVNPVTEISSTEELMNLRAQLEMGIEAEDNLVTSAVELTVQDALDAEQILRISKQTGRKSINLQSWLKEEIKKLDKNGMISDQPQSLGTLEQTYIAARIMESQTKELFSDKTEKSMNEVVNLATTTSHFDGVVARLMRAAVLNSVGRLDDTERTETLSLYANLSKSDCPTKRVRSCLLAADAALQLDDTASPLRIDVPQDLPDGAAGNEIVYRVLGMSWSVANTTDWTHVASTRGIDPLVDVADTTQPTSLRVWAASARGAIYPKLSTQQEQEIGEGLQGLTTCNGIERLVIANQRSPEKCSLDSTFAYYLSAVWGTK